MRPLRLRLIGLRSYRSLQEVDFTDVDLMAIIGDTGAGKSSLLEALCVALYGCCTWDARSAKPLIADGATTMQVELTFQSGGRTWRVTRAISRGAYPPAVHRLEGLDDGSRVDNADPVNREVQRLLGLDFPTFLKAVVLPQGKFQVLLQMSNTDRTPILKSILGLDVLTTVREQALALASRFRLQLSALETQRARLLPDPEAAVGDAQDRLTTATRQLAEFDAAREAIAKARAAEVAASARSRAAREASERLSKARVDGAEGTYGELSTLGAKLELEQAKLEANLSELAGRERELDATLARADAGAVGVAGLATAEATLAGLVIDVAEFLVERQRCDTEAAAIAIDRSALETRLESALSLKTTAEQADFAAAATESSAADAASRLTMAADTLRTAREADVAANEAARRVTEKSAVLKRQEGAAIEAEEEAIATEQAQREEEENLDVVRRVHAAAHAAARSQPGDPCPVCQRTLSEDFTRPSPPGEDVAVAACRATEKRAKDAAKAATVAATQRDESRAALTELSSLAEHATRRRERELARAGEHLGKVDLGQPDADVLAGLRQAVEESRVQVASARADAQTKRDAATAAAAEVEPFAHALKRRDKELAAAWLALERREAQAEMARCSVPESVRPASPLTVSDLEDKLALIHRRQQELAAISTELTEIRAKVSDLRCEAETVRRRQRDEVDRPASELRGKLELLADRVRHAADLLNVEAPPNAPTGGLAEESAWATVVVANAARLHAACSEKAAADAAAAAEADASVAAALASVPATDEAQLDALRVSATAAASVASKELALAEEQVPVAADLDRRIGGAGPFVEALDELARLLTDGRFVGAVVKRKQRALLGVASELLGSMTASRYGFSDGFQVVDQLSGQPRDVKTLSGGETFLASLALGLALIELAGRVGGRLEALFLDEGFGSLDANALTEAMDALASQAEGGRLVAVISHLRAVAENLERVLVVTKGPSGSELHWADRSEHNELMADDIKTGLLT